MNVKHIIDHYSTEQYRDEDEEQSSVSILLPSYSFVMGPARPGQEQMGAGIIIIIYLIIRRL